MTSLLPDQELEAKVDWSANFDFHLLSACLVMSGKQLQETDPCQWQLCTEFEVVTHSLGLQDPSSPRE